jgi:hypothetical protein
MKHPFAKILALLLATVGCLSVSSLDGFGMIVPYAYAVVCLPIMAITFAYAGWNALREKPSGKGALMVLAVLAAFFLGWLVGLGINHARIYRAKAFAATAVPIILEYQKAHPELEELPERLDEIPNMPSVPGLMDPQFSVDERSGVRVDIINPYDYRKNWAYSSKTRRWIGWSL